MVFPPVEFGLLLAAALINFQTSSCLADIKRSLPPEAIYLARLRTPFFQSTTSVKRPLFYFEVREKYAYGVEMCVF